MSSNNFENMSSKNRKRKEAYNSQISDSEVSDSENDMTVTKKSFTSTNKKLLLQNLKDNINTKSFLSQSSSTSTPNKQTTPNQTITSSKNSTIQLSPLATPIDSALGNDTTSEPESLAQESSRSESPNKDDDNSTKKMLRQLLRQNKELLERVSKLEDEKSNSKTRSIKVPNIIRHQVKQAYEARKKSGLSLWNQDDSGPFTDRNLEFTNYIRKFVEGLHKEFPNRDSVINKAIQMYFNSKNAQARRTKRDPQVGKKIAHNQRKIHKSNRRKKALEEIVPFDVIAKEERESIIAALCPEMMSSEDEKENEEGGRYFEVRRPAFRRKRFGKIIKTIDQAYYQNMSRRSKDQMIPRKKGEESNRSPSNVLKRLAPTFVRD